jgi:hypothetical protein
MLSFYNVGTGTFLFPSVDVLERGTRNINRSGSVHRLLRPSPTELANGDANAKYVLYSVLAGRNAL